MSSYLESGSSLSISGFGATKLLSSNWDISYTILLYRVFHVHHVPNLKTTVEMA
jgi:hypothetical protein